jgi:isoleucyl-tRNA synthetase
MEVARKLTNLGRSVRNKVNIKLRQPLRKAIMVVPQEKERERALPFTSIIQEELNVKEIEWISHLPEEVTVSLKPRFSILGPRYGQKVKEIARLLKNLEEDKSRQFWEMGEVSLLLEGEEVILKREEVELELQAREGLAVESEGEYAVILDTFLDQELQEEGMVRDLIHAIQIWRKEAGLEVEDRIELEVREGTDPEWIDLIEKYSSLIQDEVLASSLSLCGDGEREIISKEWELNGKKLVLALRRRL